MTAITTRERRYIEDLLGRELTDSELHPVDSLDALTREQLAVVAAIQPRSVTVPVLFLRAVVPTASSRDIMKTVDQVFAIIAARFPPELGNLPLFERYAGRALSAAEKSPVASLEALSPVHLAIAATLARQEKGIACLYLRRIAPSTSPDECDALAAQLAAEPEV